MAIITDPVFYIITIPAVLLFGMAKGGLGPGPAAVVVPIMSLVIDPVRAAAIILPILCVMDLFAVWNFRKTFDVYHLKILLPAGVIGIIAASLLMGYLGTGAIRFIIGIIAVLFCLNYWLKKEVQKKKKPGKISGFIWGALAGFTSTQIHAGGPPISVYLLPQRLDKLVLMGTLSIFFIVINYIKLIPYALLGQLDPANLLTSLVLMPLAPVGVKLGYIVLHKISQKAIYRFLYIVLFLSGCKLIYDSIF